MVAKELISHTFPTILCSDVGKKALNIMESFRVSEIPIVSNKEYLGLVSDKNIYDNDLNKSCIGEIKFQLPSPYVLVNQHIFEVIQKMIDLKLSIMPVLEMNMDYFGSILQNELAIKFMGLVSVMDPGAVIVLELNQNDYYLSQITQIIESNNAKILSLYTRISENSNILEITLKINVTDISSIIQTFVRYDYSIKAVYMDDSLLTNLYSERFGQFMKYINI
jgi:acetoin utilization protein AcuB